MFHSVILYEMLSVTSSRSLCFTALLWMKCCQWLPAYRCFTALICMKCCQWLPADRYVSQRYTVWNVVSDFQQIVIFHIVNLYEMLSVTSSRSLCFTVLLCMKCCQLTSSRSLCFTALLCMKCCQWLPADRYVSRRCSVWNVVSDFQQIVMFRNATLYEMLSVTSSRSLCFITLLCMKCCQWLPADCYISQRYSVWNVVSDFQQIAMFHNVTLYEMLSVTSSRSLCFTVLICMKCCQWLPTDHYVSQRYSVWNVVSDFQQIVVSQRYSVWNVVNDFQQIVMFHSYALYEMLSVTSSRSLRFTALLCMKCCQWLPADRNVSQRYSVWNVVSDFQQIAMFHSVTLYEMLSVTSSRSLCFTVLLCMKCCQWLPADHYVSQRYSVWNVVSDFQQIVMFHSVTLYEMLYFAS
jgi:hypothetical protein